MYPLVIKKAMYPVTLESVWDTNIKILEVLTCMEPIISEEMRKKLKDEEELERAINDIFFGHLW